MSFVATFEDGPKNGPQRRPFMAASVPERMWFAPELGASWTARRSRTTAGCSSGPRRAVSRRSRGLLDRIRPRPRTLRTSTPERIGAPPSTSTSRRRDSRLNPMTVSSLSGEGGSRCCPGRGPTPHGPCSADLARGRAGAGARFVVVIPSDCSRGLWVVLGHGKEDAKAQRHSGAARPGHPPAGPRRQARRRNHRAGRGLHGRLSERGRRGREGPSPPPSATLAAPRALSPVRSARRTGPTTTTRSGSRRANGELVKQRRAHDCPAGPHDGRHSPHQTHPASTSCP